MTIQPGIPDPRCLSVHADQLLEVVNQTGLEIEVSLAGLNARLAPGETTLFEVPLGDLLGPGVHSLSVDPCCGGELWLKGDDS